MIRWKMRITGWLLVVFVLIAATWCVYADEKPEVDGAFDGFMDLLPAKAFGNVPPEWSRQIKPVVLYEKDFSGGRNGVDWEEANRLCREYKNRYQQKGYFIVYCTFHEKNWTTIEVNTDYYTDYVFLGYVMESDHVREVYVSREVYYSWDEYQHVHYPVYKTVRRPYAHITTTHHKIYGLRVYGWGKYNEHSPWKELTSSAGVFDDPETADVLLDFGLEPGTAVFETERASVVDCSYKLIHLDNVLADYYRAKCFARKSGDEYDWAIKTQNPMIKP